MLPGMGKFKIREEDIDEKKILQTKAIIQSMTMKERENPNVIGSSRKNRIAKGSGTTVQDVNRLLKQFEQTKIMMKQMKNNKFFKF
jgi:signal recognition particle subunit SRP54